MCFKGGSDKASREMVEMQKEEAAQARQKETERQNRINTGLDAIKNAFEGKMSYKTKSNKYDWGKFANDAALNEVSTQPGASVMNQVSGLPTGYKYVHVSDPKWKAPTNAGGGGQGQTAASVTTAAGTTPSYNTVTVQHPSGTGPTKQVSVGGVGHDAGGQGVTYYPGPYGPGGHSGGGGYQTSVSPSGTPAIMTQTVNSGPYSPSSNSGGGYQASAGTGTAATGASATAPLVWAIQGPDGKIYYQGDNLNYDTQEEAGRSGGFDDAFYNKYRQGILDYYMPQVAKQYGQAKDETTYRLARAGTLKSSAATDVQKDLVDQNLKQQEKVRSNADTATSDLKTRVGNEEQKAISQLYATENPDVSANITTAAVKNITPDSYEKSALSDLFDVATIGTAGLAQGYQNQRYRNLIQQPGSQKSSSIV